MKFKSKKTDYESIEVNTEDIMFLIKNNTDELPKKLHLVKKHSQYYLKKK